jgi:membrane protease YdiL (CAAX protease family)
MVFEDVRVNESANCFMKRKWFIMHLLVGIAFPIFAWILIYSLSHWSYIRLRPWIAAPLFLTVYISTYIGVLFYYVFIYRKYGLLTLFQVRPLKKLFKELIHSVLLLLLLGFILWLIDKMLAVTFNVEVQIPEKWAWVSYAPNSILLLLFLFLGFTLIPIGEEIYFRGFVYNVLKMRLPILIALVIQALVFTTIHGYNLINSFRIFVIGIFFAIVYEMKRNLLAPTLMHCIINAMWCIPLLILIVVNLHTPAPNWSQAANLPNWLDISTFEDVEHKENGLQQWQYAVDTWGSLGSRQWKREVKAFEAVCHWFPQDGTACAKARLGIVHIYCDYLKDYRRAVLQADHLLQEYPDQREQCAWALYKMGLSYYMLKDFHNSRKALSRVVAEFKEHEDALSYSQQVIEKLDALEKK